MKRRLNHPVSLSLQDAVELSQCGGINTFSTGFLSGKVCLSYSSDHRHSDKHTKKILLSPASHFSSR